MKPSKLIFQINTTLDGYADHEAGIADDELHDFFADQLDVIDIELFGRVTYELMAGYWPDAPRDPRASKRVIAFAEKFNAMPKVVFSKTLRSADWSNTTLVNGDMIEEVKQLKSQPGRVLSVGGVSVIQQLLRHRLVDECWILVHPVLLGGGRRLFEGIGNRIDLHLLDASTFRSGVVVAHYSIDYSR